MPANQRELLTIRDDESFPPTLGGCAAGYDWFGRDFVLRQLRLEISASFVERGDDNKKGRRDKHHDSEELEVLKIGQLPRPVGIEDPGVEFSDKQFAERNEE